MLMSGGDGVLQGLSPRVRGNQVRVVLIPDGDGSIPARAGETGVTISFTNRFMGLSPRVRGNHVLSYRTCLDIGSIPARAGEPCSCSPSPRATSVYPRACGGTIPAG